MCIKIYIISDDNYSIRNLRQAAYSHEIVSPTKSQFCRQFDFSKQSLHWTSYKSLFEMMMILSDSISRS